MRVAAEDYDLEPVRYCPRCYSLRIGSIEGVEDSDYCMDCGCAESAEASIGDWERMYKARYGRPFVEGGGNPRRSRIYRMSLPELRQELYGHPRCRSIIKAFYPTFPDYLTRAEMTLLFFDRACRDKRLGELRERLAASD